MNHKEKRGIYNVSFNEKKATPINSELEAIENAIIEYVIHYVKGWHNIKETREEVQSILNCIYNKAVKEKLP